jgi:uncharacterized membrane protein
VLLDKSIRIHAPADRIFAWLQPARQPLWDRTVLRASARGGDATLRAGTLVDRVTRALGLRFESAAETVALEAGRLFAWRQVEGDYEQHRGAFVLEPDGEGDTRVHLVADVDLPFVLPRLATEAEVEDALSRDADEALFNLKAVVEGGVAG